MLKYFQEILLLKYTYYTNTFKYILISNIHTHTHTHTQIFSHTYAKYIYHIYYIQEYTYIKYYHMYEKHIYYI